MKIQSADLDQNFAKNQIKPKIIVAVNETSPAGKLESA